MPGPRRGVRRPANPVRGTSVAVVGVGAIGGTVAAALADAGCQATLCVRTPFVRLERTLAGETTRYANPVRTEPDGLASLDVSYRCAVRTDRREHRRPDGSQPLDVRKITDFHTIESARKVDGRSTEFPVVSRSEYLCDADFTAALEFLPDAAYSLPQVRHAVLRPVFTPFLGRRSCPPTR